MTNVKNMADELTGKLEIIIDDPFTLHKKIENVNQAIIAGEYLNSQIIIAEEGDNPHFCKIGINSLKESYNLLYEKFPGLKTIHPKYKLDN